MNRSAKRILLLSVWIGALLAGTIFLGGCASIYQRYVSAPDSHSLFEANHANLARSTLPRDREMPYHPDSMRYVALTEEESTYNLELEKKYETLWRKWSSARRVEMGQLTHRSGYDHRSFATFWSLDLSIASLERELGIRSISKDLAGEHIEDRKEEYGDIIHIDVYSYADASETSDTRLGTPGRQVSLVDKTSGDTYDPIHSEANIPQEAFHPDRTVVYRRNIFHFEREVDGEDILENTESLRLMVEVIDGDNYYFTWSLDEESLTTSSSDEDT